MAAPLLEPIHVSYENGAIRTGAGRLVAFYDAEAHHVHIEGFALSFYAEDLEAAMDIVGRRAPRA